jgi:hypothetical protein
MRDTPGVHSRGHFLSQDRCEETMESFQPIVADFNEILFDMENVPNCE